MEPIEIDYSKLPQPLPADESVSNIVPEQGKAFDMSSLPEPLPAQPVTQSNFLVDTTKAIAHGAESAVRETASLAGDVALNTIVPPFARDTVKGMMGNAAIPQLTDKPESTIGKIESDLVRFGLGFLAGGQLIKGAGVAANMAKSAVGTGIVADPHAERLSNMIEEHPYLKNPVTEYLAAKDDDSKAEGKFKASLEDVLTNSAVQLAVKTFKVAKQAMKGKTDDVASAASMAEDIKNIHAPKTTPAVDLAVKAQQARQAITPAWSPLQLSDEKALAFKEKLDGLFANKSIQATPANDGTVSVAHMDSSNDVLNTVTELTKMIEPEMNAAGFTAHQTNQATRELADQLGMDTDALIGGLHAAGATAEQIAPMVMAGRSMIQGLASNVGKHAERALITGEGKDLALAEMKRYVEVLSSFKTLQTGVARGLQSFGVKVGKYDIQELTTAMSGKDGDDLLKVLVMAEKDPTVISKMAQAASTSGLEKGIASHNELWINALLSGPKTHVVNTVSTGLNLMLQPLNLVVGGTLRREWADVREALAMYSGLRTHLFDSFELARKSFLNADSILNKNSTSEIKPTISALNYNLDPESVVGQGVDALGKFIRLPTRFLGAEDEFFKQLSYRSKLSAVAAREGADLVKAGKLKASELDGYISDRMAKGFNADGAGLDEHALNYADRATFTQDLKTETWLGNRSFGQTLQTLAQTHPVLRGTVLPFVRVPANLMRQVVDTSPAAIARKQYWADMKAGGQRRTEAIGKVSLGSTLWMGSALLATDGLITGAAPADPEIRKTLLATGWQPYSVRVGDKYISYNRLDPFGSILGLTADYVQISGNLPENKRDEIAQTMVLSLVNNMASKSYLKGLIETLSIVGSNDPGKIQRWLNQRAGSYIPSAVSSLNPDRELKDVRGVMDAVMTKIPGMSSSVPAKRDLFGEKVLQTGAYPYSAINPFVTSTETKDPVRLELARLASSDAQAQFNTPPAHIGNVDLTAGRNAQNQTALDRYHELIGLVTDGAGRTMHKAMLDRINSESYKRGSDGSSFYAQGSRVAQLRVIHDGYKDRAMQRLQQEFPQLKEALRLDKMNRISVKKGKEIRNPVEAILSLND